MRHHWLFGSIIVYYCISIEISEIGTDKIAREVHTKASQGLDPNVAVLNVTARGNQSIRPQVPPLHDQLLLALKVTLSIIFFRNKFSSL